MSARTLDEAQAAARGGDKIRARENLGELLKREPRNEEAWLMLAQIVEKEEQVTYCLKKVLQLNPQNQEASERLAELETRKESAELASAGIFQVVKLDSGTADSLPADSPEKAEISIEERLLNRIDELFQDLEVEIRTLGEAGANPQEETVSTEEGPEIGSTSVHPGITLVQDHSASHIELPSRTTTCPYVGLSDDPDTLTAFASGGNFCHRSAHPLPVELSYQSRFCLVEGYAECPVYQRGVKGTAPQVISKSALRRSRVQRKKVLRIGLIILLFVVLIGAILFGVLTLLS